MEVNVDTQGSCQAKISFTVPADEFANEVKKGLSEARKNMRMKGFRPGKAPIATIEKAYGTGIRGEAKQHFVRLAFQRAVDEHSLKPLGNPRVTVEDLEAIELETGQDFAFEFETDLKPDFELEDYAGLEIESELAQVRPEEIEAAVTQFKKRQARPEPAGDDGLPEDGMTICQVELTHEEDVVLEREGMRLSPETALPGVDPEAWKEALIGKPEGEVIEFAIELPDSEEIEKEAARGQSGGAKVTLTQVFKLVEPTTEELFKLLEVEDQEGFDKKVKENMEAANQEQENARVEAELLNRVIDAYSFDVPDHMVEDQLKGRLAEARAGLEAQGIEADELEKQVAAGEAEARQGAERSVRAFFVLEAIAQKEGLQVTDEEMRAELISIAQRNEVSPEEVLQFYKEQNQINQLALELAERKVRAALREKATITTPR